MVKISTSILSIKDNLIDKIKELNNTTTDFLHIDIMDGKFVNNTSFDIETIKEVAINTNKLLDVHLMVEDTINYINQYKTINPEYITIHYETKDYLKSIEEIKKNNIKAGISIKPNTKVEEIFNILKYVDLVLIMSVEPGYGGQEFIDNSLTKIKLLRQYINNNNLNVKISVDGGINNNNSKKCIEAGVDILVSGSFITNSDNFQDRIDILN